GVASTKAFTSQLVAMYKLAFHLAGKSFHAPNLVKTITNILSLNEEIKQIAHKYYHSHNILYIGRNTNFPLALEGALKLKEISYIHAEAYPAGELKHGPIALVSEDMPTVAICPQDAVYHKTYSNMEEIKARKGKVIAIATEGDENIKRLADDVIFIPKVDELLYPFCIIIPLQLLAYHIADIKKCDIDKPRNLAKSVTVE
ncbi:MAG: SIS domain-containing protein, partial [Nanoarchaeota archaeon]